MDTTGWSKVKINGGIAVQDFKGYGDNSVVHRTWRKPGVCRVTWRTPGVCTVTGLHLVFVW